MGTPWFLSRILSENGSLPLSYTGMCLWVSKVSSQEAEPQMGVLMWLIYRGRALRRNLWRRNGSEMGQGDELSKDMFLGVPPEPVPSGNSIGWMAPHLWCSLLNEKPTTPALAHQPSEKDLGGPPIASAIVVMYSHCINLEHLPKQLISLNIWEAMVWLFLFPVGKKNAFMLRQNDVYFKDKTKGFQHQTIMSHL